VDAPVKVPTAKGIGAGFKDFGIGAVAGLAMVLLGGLFGGLGFLAAPILAGAMVKGDNAKVITTVAGMALGMALLSGSASSSGGANEGVM